MKSFKTDIAVALIFFNRPDCLKEVFRTVSQARPSRLYLIQDGPRSNRPDDVKNIMLCREIVSNIDWDCEIFKDYSEVNLGCGQRIFTALTSVFNKEEYAAIIEDDIKIGESFLPFMKEMCERYKDDQRIQMVGGMNHLGVYEECPYSYFFSRGGSAIWGWATWKRCWQELQWQLDALSEPYVSLCLNNQTWYKNMGKKLASKGERLKHEIESGKIPSYWSFHFGIYGYLSNRINIVPKYNLISNIGLTGDSVHAVGSIKKIPKRLRPIFYSKIFELPAPIKHPPYITDDQFYMKKQEKIMHPALYIRVWELIEYFFLKFLIK